MEQMLEQFENYLKKDKRKRKRRALEKALDSLTTAAVDALNGRDTEESMINGGSYSSKIL